MTAQRSVNGARRITLRAGGHTLAALQAGASNAPRALLVPGFTGSKEDFGPILGRLARAGFQVTAIDLPGQYESPGLPTQADYAPDALARVVHVVASQLGPPVHLLGHSFGGFVTRAAVIEDSTPFTSHVLMDSGPSAIQGRRRALIDEMEPLLATEGIEAVHRATAAASAALPGFSEPAPEVAEFLHRRFVSGSPIMLAGMGDAVRHEPDRVAEVRASAVGLPTLVLYGAHDDAWTAGELSSMAAAIGCRAVEIPDAAHSPAVENPGATAAALIDFWRS